MVRDFKKARGDQAKASAMVSLRPVYHEPFQIVCILGYSKLVSRTFIQAFPNSQSITGTLNGRENVSMIGIVA